MLFQKYIFSIIFLLFSSTFLYSQTYGFKKALEKSSHLQMPFALKNTPNNRAILERNKVTIKEKTKEWIYITQSPQWIATQLKNKTISNFYFEYAPPTLLDDTARAMQHVNEVHNGTYPLVNGYTGKGVIVGLVDAGLDHNHPDFITANGTKRVIRYWDQSITNPTQSPQPYGYGQIWYKNQIQNGECTSNEENTGHGTTVTGICAGNGLSDGRNQGMAPDAQIIFVETNFNLPNWTLTVADACDYIFRVADSLHKPAVINLSVGSYLGSHDGKDPAAVLMDQLVNEKPGRIIVGAAGNGGNKGKYHAGQSMHIGDTNFVWFKNNPTSQIGDSTVFFDLWSDVDSAQFFYSFGANRPGPDFSSIASTPFRFAQINVGNTIFDTLRNANGDEIATLEIYTEYMNGDYHLQGVFTKLDSINYLYRFSTTGKGRYDLWSGKQWDLNEIMDTLPSAANYPPIVHYVMPDTLQTIISSWVCSPDIVSVGNLRCRESYLNHLGVMYSPPDPTPSGKIAPSSSSGPTRDGLMKPDISATGDMTLGAAPLYMLQDSAYFSLLGELGWHGRNGGTSMASPVVAGIAALYLERCPKSTAAEFIHDMKATSMQDGYTGATPNYHYGYGKIDAFALLTSKNQNFPLVGDTVICQSPVQLSASIPLYDYHWSNGFTQQNAFISQADTVSLWGREMGQGCKIYSDTVIISQESTLPNPTITLQGDSLVASSAPNYQWYKNNTPISGAIEQSYTPTSPGLYSVANQNPAGYCKSFSTALGWLLSVDSNTKKRVKVYPNPTSGYITVSFANTPSSEVQITSITGKVITQQAAHSNTLHFNMQHYAKGTYFIKVSTTEGITVIPFEKN